MDAYTSDFSLAVEGVKGFCPAGEAFAKRAITDKEDSGPRMRRTMYSGRNCQAGRQPGGAGATVLRAGMLRRNLLCASFLYGALGKEADKSVVIDGCFLKCNGRALKGLVAEGTMVDIYALPMYKKYTDVFLMEDVPEQERKAVARQVADKIITMLKETNPLEEAIHA